MIGVVGLSSYGLCLVGSKFVIYDHIFNYGYGFCKLKICNFFETWFVRCASLYSSCPQNSQT